MANKQRTQYTDNGLSEPRTKNNQLWGEKLKKSKKEFTKIDYTLEQYMEEKKLNESVIRTLEKMASLMEKFESFAILIDYRVTKLEKELKKHGKK